jgi:hypothetical protein
MLEMSWHKSKKWNSGNPGFGPNLTFFQKTWNSSKFWKKGCVDHLPSGRLFWHSPPPPPSTPPPPHPVRLRRGEHVEYPSHHVTLVEENFESASATSSRTTSTLILFTLWRKWWSGLVKLSSTRTDEWRAFPSPVLCPFSFSRFNHKLVTTQASAASKKDNVYGSEIHSW